MKAVTILCVGADQALVEFAGEVEKWCGPSWTAAALSEPEAAIAEIQTRHVDIVLADSALPQESACGLLRHVREKQPAALRYILAESPDTTNLLRLLAEAHQVIPKPFQPAALAKRLQNALGVRRLLSDELLQDKIAAVDSLPCLPDTYEQLTAELRGEHTSARHIADIISSDPAVSAKLLQLVNSAYFGASARVTDVVQAVNMVGLDAIQSLVLAVGVFEEFRDLNVTGLSVQSLRSTSMSVASRSRLLAHAFGLNKREGEDAFLGGLLHEVGTLVMARCFPHELTETLAVAEKREVPLHLAELAVVGVSTAVMGGYLLSLWGITDTVVEAVARHRNPSQGPAAILGPLTALHVAWATDSDERRRVRTDENSAVDKEYLRELGLHEQLASLRGICSGAMA